MKLIDKFLKRLGASRNTFATYILTLLTIYFAVDRLVEILLMLFTGISYSYWGPFMYTFALACPLFAFAFSPSSEFSKTNKSKESFFIICVIGLTIITVSMFTQWLNLGVWVLLVFNPGYVDLVTNFSELIKPALTALTLLFPMIITPLMFKFLYFGVFDSNDLTRSIWDFPGINLSDKKIGHGPYTCEVFLCQDKETADLITIPENSRFQSMLVCGASGSGKSSLVYEPLMAKDIERKFFFREVSKEMGFTALKTGIASLNRPYDNDYLNNNFNLNMLIPNPNKVDVFKNYMKKMILDSSSSQISYKNCGLTLLSPDREIIDDMISVCKNFKLPFNIIDPSDKKSIGLNPFIYGDSNKIAITISSVLKTMLDISSTESEEQYRESVVLQAIENVSILLKEMYPRMNEGKLPNLQDMLKMFTNFELIEKMCEIMAHNDELKEKYSAQLAYFKKNFYSDGSNKQETEKYIDVAINQLDKLLRLPGVKSILCNRTNNINFDDALENGEITFVCTRRGELGAATHKAFGLFFLISMQGAVLRRPGNEKSRVPNFLYIDEFSDFICKPTETIFTMYRKYKIATTISIQNLAQLDVSEKYNFRQTILSNCSNKIFTGGATIEELEWWEKEFGQKREWTMSNTVDFDKMKYDSKHGNVEWKFIPYFKAGKLQAALGQKDCAYKIRTASGHFMVGPGKLNYLDSKYKEPKKIKTFDFGKYAEGVTSDVEDDDNKKKKFNPRNLDFKDERNEVNPVQTDTTDSNYIFDNSDAIVVNLKSKRKK